MTVEPDSDPSQQKGFGKHKIKYGITKGTVNLASGWISGLEASSAQEHGGANTLLQFVVHDSTDSRSRTWGGVSTPLILC